MLFTSKADVGQVFPIQLTQSFADLRGRLVDLGRDRLPAPRVLVGSLLLFLWELGREEYCVSRQPVQERLEARRLETQRLEARRLEAQRLTDKGQCEVQGLRTQTEL